MRISTTRLPRLAPLAAALLLLVSAGCATAFSPQLVRDEIVRQRGEDPRRALEVSLGRFTTELIRQALRGDGEEVPFAGLVGFELAVYETGESGGPALDVTRIPVRGWEALVRLHDESRSGMVLVRGSSTRNELGEEVPSVGDLVVMGSGSTQVVYARLWGQLDPELPRTLGDILRDEGAAGLRGVFSRLADE